MGIFYTAFTQYLGFDKYGDEYKVMGLSPYGNPTMVDKLRDVLIFKDNGLFEINKKYFKHHKEGVQMSWEDGDPQIVSIYSEFMGEVFGRARQKNEELTQYHKNLASAVKVITEELNFHMLNHLKE